MPTKLHENRLLNTENTEEWEGRHNVPLPRSENEKKAQA